LKSYGETLRTARKLAAGPRAHGRRPRAGWFARVLRPESLGDQGGATLVELMVALILLSIALTGMGAAMPYGVHPVVAGGFQTTATLLSQQGIDVARNTLYTNLSTLATGGGSDCSGGTFTTVTGFPGFARCIAVSVGASTTTVTVVTRFTGVGGVGTGTIYDATLVTILAQ
jgi:prepilin-type N-terminal cleavage/methylation domain-containing protein